ncbi:MAG: hypothetical protein HC803_06195 [Saprospiraceae bacterium]|nr:hypothetical protein [Saprospiraceae bacterium]
MNLATAQTNFFPREHYTITPISTNQVIAIDNIFMPSVLENSTLDLSNAFNISTYDYNDLAIFCKLEVKMEKSAGIPIKFRLGEVNYVEQMEGKPYSIFY